MGESEYEDDDDDEKPSGAELVRFEDITNAANGVDQLGLERIVHFRAQAADNNVDYVRVSFESYIPHLFCYLSPRYHFTRRANQMCEKQKFLRREI